jgi:hypothetical protein
MATRYWVGGSGNWDATSTTNWSASSGGGSGASAPTSADNVIFDTNSNIVTGIFTVTVTGTSAGPANCLDFSTISLDGAMTLTMGATAELDVYGSLTLPATNFTWSGTSGASLVFKSTTTGKTITTNGVTLTGMGVTFNGVGGTWVLQDNFTIPSNCTTTLTAGTLDFNGKTLSTGTFSSSNSNVRGLKFDSAGTLQLTGSGASTYDGATSTNMTITGMNTGLINCTSSSAKTFAGGGLYYPKLTQSGTGTMTITGNNTFYDINNLVQPTTFTFTAGSTTTFNNFSINGTS